jgi:hypothetical protein
MIVSNIFNEKRIHLQGIRRNRQAVSVSSTVGSVGSLAQLHDE